MSAPAAVERPISAAARVTRAGLIDDTSPPNRRRSPVVRNVALNLAGQVAPLGVAYFAIPALTRGLGTERFGVLTLAWAVLGYASFFDLGLGRALTQAVAQRLGRGDLSAIASVVRQSLGWMTGLGLCGAAVLAAITPLLVARVLGVTPLLLPETRRAFFLLAASVPTVILTTGLRGVLEALGRFGEVNALRIPLGVLTFLAPTAALPFTHDLAAIVAVLFVARMLTLAAHVWAVARALRAYPAAEGTHGGWNGARELLGMGSWITVTNVIGPIMVSLDRFMIAAVSGAAVVAYYTAPYEAVTKLWLIPAALTGVLFPAFAGAVARGTGAERLLERGIRATIAALLPAVFVVTVLAPDGLAVWLGRPYAERSTGVVQLLAAGVLFNSVAQIPFVLLQGSGRASWTAKLHACELPLYVALAWYLIGRFGVIGAAVAWTSRCAVDTVVVLVLARRVTRLPRGIWSWLAGCGIACGVAAAASMHVGTAARFGFAAVGALGLLAFSVRGLAIGEQLTALRRGAALGPRVA